MKNNKSKIIVFCLIAVFTIIIYTNISYATNELPERYNLAEHYNIKVENQGAEGNCWAFSSLETLETYLQVHC